MNKYIGLLFVGMLTLQACSKKMDQDASGTFEATEVILSSELPGKILSVPVNEGDKVMAHQLIAQMDTMQLFLSKMQLGKNVLSVRNNRPAVATQIGAIQEQIRKQQTEQQRIQRLLSAGAATQKQMDDITSQILVLKNQLQAQLSTLNNSANSIDNQSSALEIQIALLEDQLSRTQITAPITGVVLSRYAEPGEFATPGKPIVKLADLDHLYLRAYLTSSQLAKVKMGDSVQVTADFGGKEKIPYPGIISWISSKSEFTPKNILTDNDRESSVYAIKIRVKNDGKIKIGTFGHVKLN